LVTIVNSKRERSKRINTSMTLLVKEMMSGYMEKITSQQDCAKNRNSKARKQ
jgi:hypothetical protein